ncbi:hypothetical protein PMIN01_04480 [Paraphaeosphaeria minitans]|uniref:Uncharacterized protein n=1 Tax=Paraphaeosphaeria minitans TaxID=565426 RepID=A0A9P6GJB6_9PLEO|nr:hypothetical protein PMIN01_04480 [Paraphaeosphaeria minitans]
MIVASKICCSSNENLRLESQPLDNFIDLGITYALMPKVRLNQHCAPLVTDGYTSLYIERQHNDSSTDICQEHRNPGVQVRTFPRPPSLKPGFLTIGFAGSLARDGAEMAQEHSEMFVRHRRRPPPHLRQVRDFAEAPKSRTDVAHQVDRSPSWPTSYDASGCGMLPTVLSRPSAR